MTLPFQAWLDQALNLDPDDQVIPNTTFSKSFKQTITCSPDKFLQREYYIHYAYKIDSTEENHCYTFFIIPMAMDSILVVLLLALLIGSLRKQRQLKNPMNSRTHSFFSYHIHTFIQLNLLLCILDRLVEMLFVCMGDYYAQFQQDKRTQWVYLSLYTLSFLEDYMLGVAAILQFFEYNSLIYIMQSQEQRQVDELFHNYNNRGSSTKWQKVVVRRSDKRNCFMLSEVKYFYTYLCIFVLYTLERAAETGMRVGITPSEIYYLKEYRVGRNDKTDPEMAETKQAIKFWVMRYGIMHVTVSSIFCISFVITFFRLKIRLFKSHKYEFFRSRMNLNFQFTAVLLYYFKLILCGTSQILLSLWFKNKEKKSAYHIMQGLARVIQSLCLSQLLYAYAHTYKKRQIDWLSDISKFDSLLMVSMFQRSNEEKDRFSPVLSFNNTGSNGVPQESINEQSSSNFLSTNNFSFRQDNSSSGTVRKTHMAAI
mmetsp:Transcript_7415/g.12528  ORF Transcript_7415/g.12528 Transcript_7415/m.12528 type:complete len:482 (+) Transcript_7415:11-1456(+)